jgi:leucyl aminopeptidase
MITFGLTHTNKQTVVDIATLTGAASVAMGHDTAALFSNSDDLAADLDTAGRGTGSMKGGRHLAGS